MKRVFSSFRVSALAIGSGLLMIFAFSACNKSNNDDNPDTPVAGLMAFNLAPDVAQAGIALSGSNLNSGPLAYNSFTGGYLGVFTGARPVESYNYASGNSLATGSFTFEDTKYYSLFIVGANDTYRNVIVNDNFDSLSSSGGQAYIRYINAIPDSSDPGVTLAASGSNVVNENADFGHVSEFTAIAPGEVSISVTNGGTIDADRTITVEQQKVYTVLLSGIPAGTGDDSVQIKFIENGTLGEDAGRSSSASARSSN